GAAGGAVRVAAVGSRAGHHESARDQVFEPAVRLAVHPGQGGEPGRRRAVGTGRRGELAADAVNRQARGAGPRQPTTTNARSRAHERREPGTVSSAQEAHGTWCPGGADSSHDRKPVSAPGPMAISISMPSVDLQRNTVAAAGRVYDSSFDGYRRSVMCRSSRLSTRSGPFRKLRTRHPTHVSP